MRAVAPGLSYRRHDKGRIAIEIEFAEIWIRRIDVKPLG
jgi:hypothetical protein